MHRILRIRFYAWDFVHKILVHSGYILESRPLVHLSIATCSFDYLDINIMVSNLINFRWIAIWVFLDFGKFVNVNLLMFTWHRINFDN